MRGNPWLRIILVGFGVILMGWPVWRLTHPRMLAVVTAPAVAAVEDALAVTVLFAHAPVSFDLSNVGQSLLSGGGSQTDYRATLPIGLPKDGTDFLLKATWPAHTPHTAVEVRVESSGTVLTDQTFWGNGTLTELVTVRPLP